MCAHVRACVRACMCVYVNLVTRALKNLVFNSYMHTLNIHAHAYCICIATVIVDVVECACARARMCVHVHLRSRQYIFRLIHS